MRLARRTDPRRQQDPLRRTPQPADHHSRHTFISHALAGGRTLAEVRDAVGHSSVPVTSAYLHVAVEDEGSVGDLFRVG